MMGLRVRTTLPWAIVLATSIAGAAPPRIDGASVVQGTARVRTNESPEWRDAGPGDVLAPGSNLEVSADRPLDLTLPDGVTLTLEPGSLAFLMPATRLPTETNGWTRGYHLVMQEGELEVRMPQAPKGTHAFLVATKAGTLTDWRGQLHVVVRQEVTAAGVYEGALVVGSNGHGFPVYDGAGILMQKGVDPDKTRGIPAAPQWERGGGALAVVADGTPATLDMRWLPVAGAASYRVEVATEPTMTQTVLRIATADTRYAPPEPTPGQRYWARARALGVDGIVGEWSAPRPVRVVHFSLPERAFLARDGAIVLPDGATLALSETDAIDVAYESVTARPRRILVPLYWTKLGGPLRLTPDAPARIVHLRDSELGSEARLLLARRELRADVDLTPKNARWPFEALDARVVLEDPSGRIDVATEDVTVSAMLDLAPLSVAWMRRANVWLGRIPPRSTAGPAVVRVVVTDRLGSEIGRGFLEIEGPSTRHDRAR